MTLIPTVGTILNMSPATGRVELKFGDEAWELPIVGYAVVVRYVGPSDDKDHIEYETSIEIVVLSDEDQYPVTINSVAMDLNPRARWSVL